MRTDVYRWRVRSGKGEPIESSEPRGRLPWKGDGPFPNPPGNGVPGPGWGNGVPEEGRGNPPGGPPPGRPNPGPPVAPRNADWNRFVCMAKSSPIKVIAKTTTYKA